MRMLALVLVVLAGCSDDGTGPSVEPVTGLVAVEVANGLVARWRVRRWVTVVGDDAASPLRTAGPHGA